MLTSLSAFATGQRTSGSTRAEELIFCRPITLESMTLARKTLHDSLRLAAIVESSDDAIISKDTDGIITSWNAAAERVFGYTSDEAVGRSIRLIIPADRQAEADHVLERIRRGERVEHFETERLRSDGTLVHVSIAVSPIRTPDGRIIGASKIARDITDRKQTE
jgi:PAS domain S-box-containing protein